MARRPWTKSRATATPGCREWLQREGPRKTRKKKRRTMTLRRSSGHFCHHLFLPLLLLLLLHRERLPRTTLGAESRKGARTGGGGAPAASGRRCRRRPSHGSPLGVGAEGRRTPGEFPGERGRGSRRRKRAGRRKSRCRRILSSPAQANWSRRRRSGIRRI
mgnify:CR=1 FL=1